MRILQISTSSDGGGAERLALTLHRSYLERGHDAHLLTGVQRRDEKNLHGLMDLRTFHGLAARHLLLYGERWTGIQGVFSPFFRRWIQKNGTEWDVIHCHNLHGSGYMSFRDLTVCAPQAPMVITLHDLWLLTGHCAHPVTCERFTETCGSCPDLQRYVRVSRDHTHSNAHRKREFLDTRRPVLVGVSEWVCRSVRIAGIENDCRVIYNGVDTKTFFPTERRVSRKRLGLPEDMHIVLYVVSGGLCATRRNDYKRPQHIVGACRRLKATLGPHAFRLLTVGGKGDVPADLADVIIQYGHVASGLDLFYSAADVTVHASCADSMPLVLIESMACGTPVVTTNAGGCSEGVSPGETGYVVPLGDEEAMAAAVGRVLAAGGSVWRDACCERVRTLFTQDRMVNAYLDLYARIQTPSGHKSPDPISDPATMSLC